MATNRKAKRARCKANRAERRRARLRRVFQAQLRRGFEALETCPPDLDLHTWVAAAIFDVAPDAVTAQQRYFAKTITFGRRGL